MPAGNHYVVTASFTVDGSNCWRRLDGTWSRRLDEAGLVADEVVAKAQVASAVATEQREVSDPYVIEVHAKDDGTIAALSARERIRATGPTVPVRRPDRGLGR